MLAGMAGTLLLSFLVATSLTRSHAGGHSAERSAVPDLDATVTSTSVPLPAPPQAATVQPRDDASVAVHTQPGVAPNAPRTIAPVVHDVSRERVDAGFAVGADAATATVENDVDHDTQGQPNPVPIEVKNPSVGRNALVVERKPNPSDRKPQPLERRPDRDQTFNPFKKGLR